MEDFLDWAGNWAGSDGIGDFSRWDIVFVTLERIVKFAFGGVDLNTKKLRNNVCDSIQKETYLSCIKSILFLSNELLPRLGWDDFG